MPDQSNQGEHGGKNDRRQHSRVPVRVEATFRDGEDLIASYLFNISEGGLLVRSDRPLDLGTEVVLSFRLPGSGHLFTILGQVIWSQPPGERKTPAMGIAFVDMRREDSELLHDFISRHLAG